jgi:hypothetical protein
MAPSWPPYLPTCSTAIHSPHSKVNLVKSRLDLAPLLKTLLGLFHWTSKCFPWYTSWKKPKWLLSFPLVGHAYSHFRHFLERDVLSASSMVPGSSHGCFLFIISLITLSKGRPNHSTPSCHQSHTINKWDQNSYPWIQMSRFALCTTKPY